MTLLPKPATLLEAREHARGARRVMLSSFRGVPEAPSSSGCFPITHGRAGMPSIISGCNHRASFIAVCEGVFWSHEDHELISLWYPGDAVLAVEVSRGLPALQCFFLHFQSCCTGAPTMLGNGPLDPIGVRLRTSRARRQRLRSWPT